MPPAFSTPLEITSRMVISSEVEKVSWVLDWTILKL